MAWCGGEDWGGQDGEAGGVAALVLVGPATPLHPEPALFEAMIEGWRRQHAARRLSPTIPRCRERTVHRFQEFTGSWPWEWRSEQLESWVAQGEWAHDPPPDGRAALTHLAARLPAAMLARLLNIAPTTAVRWVRTVGGDWTTYAGQILRENDRES